MSGAERERIRHLFIETLVRFARERVDVTSVRLKTRGYLQLAAALDVEDANPKAPMRIEPDCPAFGYAQQVVPEYRGPRTFRLGPSFQIRLGPSFQTHGPRGLVTVEEDPS